MEIKVMHQVMEWNEDVSDAVKAELAEHQVCLINVMGSPGAGKTSMIVSLINRLRETYHHLLVPYIDREVDLKTVIWDVIDIRIPVVQLDTDGACHIEAMSIQHLLKEFSLPDLDIILVENIGNLVCPAEFNIGENFRIALLSVPEGDDKVVKYPLMFATTDALVLNKFDMQPYFDFDDQKVEADAKGVNPNVNVFRVSSRTGDGLGELTEWISNKVNVILGKEKGGV